jgi:hypothetical protein
MPVAAIPQKKRIKLPMVVKNHVVFPNAGKNVALRRNN